MNKITLFLSSVIALCSINNDAKSYQGLEISRPFNTISNKFNTVIDSVKQSINDNMSIKSLSTNDNSIINGVKNTVNDLKTQVFSNNSINNLKKNLQGKTITCYTSDNKVSNANSFSITPNKSKEQNTLVEKKTELTSSKKLSKQEERQAIKIMKNLVNDYLEKKNIKLFVANTKEKLDKYTKELEKKHSYNMAILDKMLINSALADVAKDKPKYQEVLRNNLSYNFIVSLFALNADTNKDVFNYLAENLSKNNIKLSSLDWKYASDLYYETKDKINEKLKNTEESKSKNKLTIENNNSFSIIGNKKEKRKFDDLKISNEQYLPKIKTKLSTLKDEDKSALLDDFSDVLNGNDDIKINNKSVDQYFKSSNSLNTDQKLYDIMYSLVSVGMFSQVMSLFNPFSSSISLMSTVLTSVITSSSNSKPIVTISTTSCASTAYFGNYFGFGNFGFGYSFGSMFNSFMPSFGFGTMFTSSFFGW